MRCICIAGKMCLMKRHSKGFGEGQEMVFGKLKPEEGL